MRGYSLVLVAALGCGGAQGEPVEPEPAVEVEPEPAEPAEPAPQVGSHVVARNFDVAPGKFAEINLELEGGVVVTAAFRSDGDVQWNVHSHPEDGVAVHREGSGSEGKIEFEAATAGGYSYLWTNPGDQPVNLLISVELPTGARIVSWHPEDR